MTWTSTLLAGFPVPKTLALLVPLRCKERLDQDDPLHTIAMNDDFLSGDPFVFRRCHRKQRQMLSYHIRTSISTGKFYYIRMFFCFSITRDPNALTLSRGDKEYHIMLTFRTQSTLKNKTKQIS
ncbi:hypothetical protein ACFO8Q_06185 [Effusibacillus consociatus]|uniref:Uncharacterized protein n=1 Tax=Effusibacillus consociatus TaxID=1117041 RepID=A0ABV9Q0T3_9BACL